MTTANLISDLKRDEGCELTAYPDPLSGGEPWTIGYGCTGAGIAQGVTWTQAQADQALDERAAQIGEQLDMRLSWWRQLSDLRQDVLVNMAYNLGVDGLMKFHHMLAALDAGNYAGAADQMLASAWAVQVGQRATRLAQQMRTGEHQS